MAIQMRRGANANFDKSKMLPGEIAVTTDGTRKVYAAFASNDVKELASKDDVNGLIDGFTSVVDREIAEAEQRIESKAETVLGTIPDDYETVSKKADEAVRTKADAIVCTVSGVNPIAKDSSNDYLRNLKLYGKTTQTITSGKQLCNIVTNNMFPSTNGTIINQDGCRCAIIDVTNFDNIYISGDFSLLESGSIRIGLCTEYPSVGVACVRSNISSNGTLEVSQYQYVLLSFLLATSGMDWQTISDSFMVNEGTTALPWEKYTGLQPSPSPNYQQKLVSKGKWGNLFNKETAVKGYVLGSTGVPYSSATGFYSDAIKVKEGKSYTFTNVTWFNFYTNGETPTSDNFVSQSGASTIVAPTGAKYVRIVGNIEQLDSIMLNEGTTALPYRPYTGQLEVESGVYGKNLFDYETHVVNGYSSIIRVIGGQTLYRNGKIGTGNYEIYDKYGALLGTFASFGFTANNPLVLPIESSYIKITDVYAELSSLYIGYDSDTTYEPYTHQSHISIVGDGLKGIPVTDSSLATYTDENGQMIRSDETNNARSVKIQRSDDFKLTSDMEWYTHGENKGFYAELPLTVKNNVLLPKSGEKVFALCTIATSDIWTKALITDGLFAMSYDGYIGFGYSGTLEEFKTMLDTVKPKVQYLLKEPIETPLSASEIASFKALHSNYKVTTVMNDCECFESITYNADTETWINNKIEARVASALASLSL